MKTTLAEKYAYCKECEWWDGTDDVRKAFSIFERARSHHCETGHRVKIRTVLLEVLEGG